jgi:hypothetical protein
MKIRNADKLGPTQVRPYQLAEFVVAENGNGLPIVLHLAHVSSSRNKEWKVAVLKAEAEFGSSISEPAIRSLIPTFTKTAIRGWDNAFDENGAPEAYTPERGEKLLFDLMAHDESGQPVAIETVVAAMIYASTTDLFRGAEVAAKLGKE